MKGPNELEWQRRIVKSVKKQGGYASKWSTSLLVGKPDLIIAYMNSGPVHPFCSVTFMEVKLIKFPPIGFKRLLPLENRQRHELGLLRAVRARAVVGVVVYRGPRDVHLLAVRPDRPHIRDDHPYSVPWVPNDGFDVEGLISHYSFHEPI